MPSKAARNLWIWAIASALSAAIFGWFGHTWLLTGIGATVPTGVLGVATTAVQGDMIGAELLLRLVFGALSLLAEAMR